MVLKKHFLSAYHFKVNFFQKSLLNKASTILEVSEPKLSFEIAKQN